MNIIIKALATVGLCGLLVLPGFAQSGNQRLDDQRFITAETTVGKTLAEVRKEIGEPGNKGPCSMSTLVKGKTVAMSGEGWAYRYIYSDGSSHLSICFIKGLVVAEKKTNNMIEENERQYLLTRETLDHRLLRNIIDGDPGRPTWVDPEGPQI